MRAPIWFCLFHYCCIGVPKWYTQWMIGKSVKRTGPASDTSLLPLLLPFLPFLSSVRLAYSIELTERMSAIELEDADQVCKNRENIRVEIFIPAFIFLLLMLRHHCWEMPMAFCHPFLHHQMSTKNTHLRLLLSKEHLSSFLAISSMDGVIPSCFAQQSLFNHCRHHLF